jgi:hypothetical protein
MEYAKATDNVSDIKRIINPILAGFSARNILNAIVVINSIVVFKIML